MSTIESKFQKPMILTKSPTVVVLLNFTILK